MSVFCLIIIVFICLTNALSLERISIDVVLCVFCSTFGVQKLVQHAVTNHNKDAVFLANEVVYNPAMPIVLLAASFSRAL